MKWIIPLLCCLLRISVPATSQDTILLFHPTTGNLEVLQNLMNRDILPLEMFHVKGVYHASGSYDYGQTARLIREQDLDHISLVGITAMVDPGGLFGGSDFTAVFRELFESSSGAFFMGGPDIPPRLYGEEQDLLTVVTDPARHYLEASFLFHLLGGFQDPGWEPFLLEKPGYLVSGICLGMQTMNVATGGTLVQDIPTEIYGTRTIEAILDLPQDQVHRNYRVTTSPECAEPTSYHFHRIVLPEGSFLEKMPGMDKNISPMVLSSHHQGVEKTGMDFQVAAYSVDGKVVEAISHRRFPHVFGVQFHPEKPGLYDPGLVHPLDCTDSISFHGVVCGTPSQEFHRAYWNYIGRILQQGIIRSQ